MRPPGLAASRVARLLTALATVVVVMVVALVLVGSAPVTAHTDLEFTMPTDGAAVGEPVAEVTIGFTDPVTLVGPGFEVLDPAGDVLAPFVATDDDRVFLLQFDPPLAGGDVAVRYEVRAEDGHTITGGFAFTVTAEAPTTTVAPTETTVPTTTTVPTASTVTSPTIVPTTTAATATVAPDASIDTFAPDGSSDPESDGSGSSSGVYVGIALAVAVAAAVFLVVRARSSAPG